MQLFVSNYFYCDCNVICQNDDCVILVDMVTNKFDRFTNMNK